MKCPNLYLQEGGNSRYYMLETAQQYHDADYSFCLAHHRFGAKVLRTSSLYERCWKRKLLEP